MQYPPDKRIQNYEFSFKAKLGKGAYGSVFAGKNTVTDQVVALKVIDKKILQTEYANQLIASEIEIMKKINNKNIVQMIDVVQTVNNTYIITEYCNGGDLREYLKKKKVQIRQVTEQEALRIFQNLLFGVRDLLDLGIIHRDIKPANILLHDGIFKITDFGFAKQVYSHSEAIMNSLVGTPLYMSPQILKRQHYSSKCDIWSLGLIFYEMIYGQTPWHSTNLVELMAKLDNQPLSFPVYPQVSDDTKQLIKMCLQIPEPKRINWPQLFEHPLCQITATKQPPQLQQIQEIYKPIQNNSSLITTTQRNKTQHVKELPIQQQPTSSKSRSNSNSNFVVNNNEETNKPSFRNYLEQNNNTNLPNFPRVKTEYDRERSHSQVNFWKYNTQKIDIHKETEDQVTPLIQPSKKYASNTSTRTPSAMQSQSTNASKGGEQDVKINEFKVADEKEDSKSMNRIFGQYQRIKRTNSMTTRILMPKTSENLRTPIQSLLKIISNQQDLIPNHITLKNDISQMLHLHKKILNSSTDQIYNSDDQQMVQALIKKLADFIKSNESDHFLVQVQVMLLLVANYKQIIDQNIQTGQLNISQTILELIQKNQSTQQNQLKMNQKALNQQIKQQIRL